MNDGAKFGYKAPNGTFTGVLNTLRSHTSDVAFVGTFIKDYETRDVEFSTAVYMDQLCLIDPPAGRIPPFLLPLKIFSPKLWLFLLLETFLGEFKTVLRCEGDFGGLMLMPRDYVEGN